MKKLSFLLILLLATATVFAQQTTNGVDMADTMYSSGRIYVVIATIAIVFIGLAIYLFTMDRRLTKLEK